MNSSVPPDGPAASSTVIERLRTDDLDRVLLALVARGGVTIQTAACGKRCPAPDGGASFAGEVARRLSGMLAAGYLAGEQDGPVRLTVKGVRTLRGR